MSNDCCTERPNFGHPACIGDLGGVSRFVFVGLANSTEPFVLSSDLDYETLVTRFTDYSQINDVWRPFPEVQNFVWTPAESQFEDASNGKKSFIKSGKISIACETWDGDATAKMIAKMVALRCSNWGVYLVTDENKLVGSFAEKNGFKKLYPIKIDAQSIEALFQFKTDATTQKIMFNFDLDRNFDVSTLYAIDGDLIFNETSEEISPIDFNNDLPNIIDCKIEKSGAFSTTGGQLIINDDYRQGTRNTAAGDILGNVTGLTIADFLVENLTDATVVTVTSVSETLTGNYAFTIPAQTASDILKVSIKIPTQTLLRGDTFYQGSLTLTV